VCYNDPPPISSLLEGAPAEVDRAFAWALCREPDERPESAEVWVESFVDALESIPPRGEGWSAEAFDAVAAKIGTRREAPVNVTKATRLERQSRL